MTQPIHDPEVRQLAAIAGIIEQDYRNANTDWIHSPFGWIKTLPSRSSGAVFESLVAGWCAAKGLDVARSPDSDDDRVISGLRTEIKGSTLWRNGSYKFQQLRDQDYSIVVCLGVSPFDAHCWVIEKVAVMECWDNGVIRSQHGGATGSDTAWITVNPANPPSWLRPCGGTLNEGFARLQSLIGQT
jgi:hypothetical protein